MTFSLNIFIQQSESIGQQGKPYLKASGTYDISIPTPVEIFPGWNICTPVEIFPPGWNIPTPVEIFPPGLNIYIPVEILTPRSYYLNRGKNIWTGVGIETNN